MAVELAPFAPAPLIPLWIKIGYTAFVAILIPIYWKKWGPANFLWFSDIALFVMLAAVWLESSLLTSMMGIAVLAPELAWNVGYFTRLLTGKRIFSLTDYMFDQTKPLWLRALSLFHVLLPTIIIWLLCRLGFREDSLLYQIGLGWAVLLFTYFFTGPKENINWVFGPGTEPQHKLNPHFYFLLVLLAFPLIIYLPTYFLLRLIF